MLELTENDFSYGNIIFPYENIINPVEYNIENGYSQEDELEIYATYRVALNNQNSTTAKVNSISYYYDANYNFEGVNKGTASSITQVEIDEEQYYIDEEQYYIDEKPYKKVDITNLNLALNAGEQEYIYITLKMISSDNEISTGEYNTIAEITSYSTEEGKVDIDSAPGNAVRDKKLVYEDDTDKAPGLDLEKNNEVRKLNGVVWEDNKRYIKNNDGDVIYSCGNGIKTNGENGLENIIVQLIEVRDGDVNSSKKYYIWQQTKTNENGKYEFNNIVPGEYIVRFIYGATDETKTYNGQDYKSATDNYYDDKGRWLNEYYNKGKIYSLARDNEARRLDVMANTAEIDRELGEALRDKSDKDEWKYIDNTYMFADTSLINIAVASETGEETIDKTTVDGKKNKYNNFESVNFGLEERQRTVIKMEKHLTGLRITASDGTTILDANVDSYSDEMYFWETGSIIKNLQAFYATYENMGKWQVAADIEEVIQGANLELEYTYTVNNNGAIDYIGKELADSFENETIDGYKRKLRNTANNIRANIGSDEYYESFGKYLGSTYYTGEIADDVTKVKTHVGKIEDYINNDLKFTEVESSDFRKNKTMAEYQSEGISETDITSIKPEYKDKSLRYKTIILEDSNGNDEGAAATNDVEINTVVVSKNDIGYMEPGETKTQTIKLESNGKLTSTGTLNFPGYIAQIKTAYRNAAGRRDEYSIPGNLKYISIPETCSLSDKITYEKNGDIKEFITDIEWDSFWVEEVVITKPTGADKQLIITLTATIIAALAIVGGGIFAIKKYVL